MTKEELLKPRFKVIADYPLSINKVGDLLQCRNNLYCIGMEDGTGCWFPERGKHEGEMGIADYPHLFKKLEWWESRKAEDLPEYLRHTKMNFVCKVREWNLLDRIVILTDGSCLFIKTFEPSTEEEYFTQQREEEEYNNTH